jgi:hypothetical protein
MLRWQQALLSVLGPRDIPLLVDELINFMEGKISLEIASYITAILEALPPLKLPSLQVCCDHRMHFYYRSVHFYFSSLYT